MINEVPDDDEARREIMALDLLDGFVALRQKIVGEHALAIAVVDDSVSEPGLNRWIESRTRIDARAEVVRTTTDLSHGDRMVRAILNPAPGCRVHVVEVGDARGEFDRQDVADALRIAVERRPRIINLSLAFRRREFLCSDANPCVVCAAATGAAAEGILVVVASGNFGEEGLDSCPASARGVLRVAATNGPTRTVHRTSARYTDTGTSVAAARTTAACALVMSAVPDATSDDVTSALSNTLTLLERENRRVGTVHPYRAAVWLRAQKGGPSRPSSVDVELNLALKTGRVRDPEATTLTRIVSAMTPNERRTAQQDFLRLVELAPWSPNVRLGAALLHEANGDEAAALVEADEVTALQWALPEAHNAIARLLVDIDPFGADVESRIATQLTDGDQMSAALTFIEAKRAQAEKD